MPRGKSARASPHPRIARHSIRVAGGLDGIMRPMDRTLRMGAGIAALLVGFVVISPAILGGRRLGAIDLLVLAGPSSANRPGYLAGQAICGQPPQDQLPWIAGQARTVDKGSPPRSVATSFHGARSVAVTATQC